MHVGVETVIIVVRRTATSRPQNGGESSAERRQGRLLSSSRTATRTIIVVVIELTNDGLKERKKELEIDRVQRPFVHTLPSSLVLDLRYQ